jgi:hypothetical protein
VLSMKHTLALVLMVFGSFGAFAEEDCATKPTTEEILECINILPSEEEERELREAEKRYEKLMAEALERKKRGELIDLENKANSVSQTKEPISESIVKNCTDRYPKNLDKVFQCMKENKANSVSQTAETSNGSINDSEDCSGMKYSSWHKCKYGDLNTTNNETLKVNLICKMVKSGAKKSTDIYDNRGRKIGKTQKQDNEKYSVNIEIDGTKANLSFDEKLLPKLNSGTSLSGTVRTFDDRFVIEYQPNKFNKSTLTINRYSGSAEIEAESFGGWGSIIRDFSDAYEGKRSSKIKKIGSCEGGSEKKF